VSERTLRYWVRTYAPGKDPPRPGRPPHSASDKMGALYAVRREMRKQGLEVGAEALHHGLGKRVPLRLVRYATARIKERRRRRHAEHRVRARTSMQVLARDAMWGLDATHLGRDGSTAVEAQVIKDLATLCLPGQAVSAPAKASDALRFLDETAAARGTLPLVLVSDNGSPYVADATEAWLEERQVIHLLNLPHTPQHNGATERAMRDPKAETKLGKGVQVDTGTAATRFAQACTQINDYRRRRSLGYRTARDYDRRARRWYDLTSRAAFYAAARRAIKEAVEGLTSGHDKRKRTRGAILATLESFGLIKRTRGSETLS